MSDRIGSNKDSCRGQSSPPRVVAASSGTAAYSALSGWQQQQQETYYHQQQWNMAYHQVDQPPSVDSSPPQAGAADYAYLPQHHYQQQVLAQQSPLPSQYYGSQYQPFPQHLQQKQEQDHQQLFYGVQQSVPSYYQQHQHQQYQTHQYSALYPPHQQHHTDLRHYDPYPQLNAAAAGGGAQQQQRHYYSQTTEPYCNQPSIPVASPVAVEANPMHESHNPQQPAASENAKARGDVYSVCNRCCIYWPRTSTEKCVFCTTSRLQLISPAAEVPSDMLGSKEGRHLTDDEGKLSVCTDCLIYWPKSFHQCAQCNGWAIFIAVRGVGLFGSQELLTPDSDERQTGTPPCLDPAASENAKASRDVYSVCNRCCVYWPRTSTEKCVFCTTGRLQLISPAAEVSSDMLGLKEGSQAEDEGRLSVCTDCLLYWPKSFHQCAQCNGWAIFIAVRGVGLFGSQELLTDERQPESPPYVDPEPMHSLVQEPTPLRSTLTLHEAEVTPRADSHGAPQNPVMSFTAKSEGAGGGNIAERPHTVRQELSPSQRSNPEAIGHLEALKEDKPEVQLTTVPEVSAALEALELTPKADSGSTPTPNIAAAAADEIVENTRSDVESHSSDDNAKEEAQVPACPRDTKWIKREWYRGDSIPGWAACVKCWQEALRGTKFEEKFEKRVDEDKDGEQSCMFYSPRMRGIYEAACSRDDWTEFETVAAQRCQLEKVFLERAMVIKKLFEMALLRQQSLWLAATYASGGAAIADIAGGDTGYRYGNSQLGWYSQVGFAEAAQMNVSAGLEGMTSQRLMQEMQLHVAEWKKWE